MSKAWLVIVVLGLSGGVAVAKDKGHASHDTPKHAAPKSEPAPAAPRPSPAPAPRPAPAATPAQRPAAPSIPNPAPAVTQRPTQPPATKPHPSSAPSLSPMPSASAPSNTPPKPPAIPFGKTGSAIGPAPAPGSGAVDTGRPLLPNAQNHVDHKHPSGQSVPRGTHSTSPLPTPPKFETSGKIPPFGSPIAVTPKPNLTTPAHKNDHKPAATPRLPGNTNPGTQPDRTDRSPDLGPRNTDDRHHDDHNGSHYYGHSSGYRRPSGLSWLIIGGSSFGPSSYGYGYGPGYYAPTYIYPSPTTVYVPAPVVNPNVNINPMPAAGPPPPRQQQLTPDEFAALPHARQQELLLQAVNALEEDFARSPNGEDWSRHLQLVTVAKLVTHGDQRPDATLRARLRSVVQLFDEVAANADYQAVSELTSFRVLHMGLHEFAAEDIDRSRRQLSQAAASLSKSLETWSSGQRWRDYLQTEWMIGTDEEMQIDLDARLVRFEKLLDKFDRVKSDDQFQVVTQPRDFGLTHEALRRFVGHLQQLVAEVRNTDAQEPKPELVIPAAPR